MNIRSKRFRYGTFSTAMMLVAVALFLLVNLLASELSRPVDLTAEQMFSLSSQSHEFLRDLDQSVTIYSIAPTGNQHRTLSQLLVEYESASSFITVEHRDPMINPALIHQLAAAAGLDDGISNGSVVIQSADRIRVLSPPDMMTFDWQTGVPILNIEPAMTRAIHYVTQGTPTVVYQITGSGESPLSPAFLHFLASENFDMREVNAVIDDIPGDVDILFITAPARDWTEIKADRILSFLQNQGNAFIAMDYIAADTPNLDSVLAAYGMAISGFHVMEGNSNNIFMNIPFYIIPNAFPHEITNNLRERNLPTLTVLPTSIEILDARMTSTDITPLWITSADAFGRIDAEVTTPSRIPGDAAGPFNLAVVVTDTHFTDQNMVTQMVVVSNREFMGDAVVNFIGAGNWNFVLNSLRWMQGQQPSIFIPPSRPPGTQPLMMTQMQANMLAGASMGLVPLICLSIGVFIWFKRRNS